MLKQKQAQYSSNPKPASKAQLELKCSFTNVSQLLLCKENKITLVGSATRLVV